MPSLKERIDADLKVAMRSKDELGTSVLRMLKSAVKYKEVEPGGHALEDPGVLAVIQTQVKQRRESAEQFRAGNRPELAEREEQEILRLQSYLPAALGEDELRVEVRNAIAQVGAKGPRDMGAVMKALQPRVAGRAEGKTVAEAVKAELAKL
jgi:uncharacterized protein